MPRIPNDLQKADVHQPHNQILRLRQVRLRSGSGIGNRQATCAFTLIEMLVVFALSAILAGIVAVSLAGSFHTARAQDVAGNLANYDRLSREYFRKFGRSGTLVFDLGRGTVMRIDSSHPDATSASLRLPGEFHFGQLVMADKTSTAGEVPVICSSDGLTPSYALELIDNTGKPYWMVTAGLTGKAIQVDNEQEVRDIFRAIGSGEHAP